MRSSSYTTKEVLQPPLKTYSLQVVTHLVQSTGRVRPAGQHLHRGHRASARASPCDQPPDYASCSSRWARRWLCFEDHLMSLLVRPLVGLQIVTVAACSQAGCELIFSVVQRRSLGVATTGMAGQLSAVICFCLRTGAPGCTELQRLPASRWLPGAAAGQAAAVLRKPAVQTALRLVRPRMHYAARDLASA